jgi:hypothetical protein
MQLMYPGMLAAPGRHLVPLSRVLGQHALDSTQRTVYQQS